MPLGPDPGLGYVAPTSARDVLDLEGEATRRAHVDVAEEVPVALAYNQHAHVVVMCSPTDLEDLAVGFTVTERIAAYSNIASVDVARHSRGIEITMEIPAADAESLFVRQRAMSARAGCGICGVEAINDAVRPVRQLQRSLTVDAEALYDAGAALNARQPLNQETHAIHAAAWALPNGDVKFVREDVGRHNALDKTLGALLRAGIEPSAGFLVLTSRASMELVQKAGMCGVELVAAVSRPTGLAIRLAEEGGMTLVGVLRGKRATVYAHPERIRTT